MNLNMVNKSDFLAAFDSAVEEHNTTRLEQLSKLAGVIGLDLPDVDINSTAIAATNDLTS